MTILEELTAAEVQVELDGDRLKLKGKAVPPALVARVRAHKDELMQALTPRLDAPLRHEPFRLTPEQVDRVCNLMDSEPLRAFGWVLGANGRADRYEADRGWSPRDCDLTAAVEWLMIRRGLDPEGTDSLLKLMGPSRRLPSADPIPCNGENID